MKISMMVLVLFTLTAQLLMAENKKEESYNYKRGVELLLEDDDMERGLSFLNKEIADHKDNGYAHLWISKVYFRQEKYGPALDAAYKAIKHLSKDTEKLSLAYLHRADIYDMLGEEDKMLNDLKQATKYDPENRDAYKMLGEYFFTKQDYDLSDSYYQKMIELNPGDVYIYMALGRNEMFREHYQEAIDKFEYVMKLDPEYVYAYPFRADAKLKQKKYGEAMDDVIFTFQKDVLEDKVGYVFATLLDSVPQLSIAKLKAQVKKDPNNAMWQNMLAWACQNNKQWVEAIKWYESALELEQDPAVGSSLKECYYAIGDLNMALHWVNWSLAQDSTEIEPLLDRVILEDELGMKEEAMRHVDELIEMYPDNASAYYRRGWMMANSHERIKDAIDAYTMAITLQPEHAYSYIGRGKAYRQQGKMEQAKTDFEKCLELDPLCRETNISMYAAYYLGDTCRALALKDTILAEGRTSNYYDVACLFSLIDNPQQALQYLSLYFEGNGSNSIHVRRDPDLEPVRRLPEFEALMLNFESKWKAEQSTLTEAAEYEEELIEIPFTMEGGICKVKCSINGLPLYFYFDTGASDIGISSVEAAFMLKNGYLDNSDFYGKAYYTNANGDIFEGTNIRLREINFGGLVLKDVRASVAKSQKAPLLLGQTALQRLGKIEIDNERKVLRVNRMVKKN